MSERPYTAAEILACGCEPDIQHCRQCDARREANARWERANPTVEGLQAEGAVAMMRYLTEVQSLTAEREEARAEVRRLEAVLRGAESAICDLHQEREALRAEVARREADESAWRRTAAILREENAAHWQVKERLEAAREDDQKRAAAMMLDIGNKWVDALEEKKAEIVRLRTALAVFADEESWGSQGMGVYVWKTDAPWKLAQEALETVAAAQEK